MSNRNCYKSICLINFSLSKMPMDKGQVVQNVKTLALIRMLNSARRFKTQPNSNHNRINICPICVELNSNQSYLYCKSLIEITIFKTFISQKIVYWTQIKYSNKTMDKIHQVHGANQGVKNKKNDMLIL